MQKLVAQQKKTIAVVVLSVLVLSLITLHSTGEFIFKPKPVNYTEQQKQFQANLIKNREDYEAYLKSLEIDPEASKLLFKQILDEKQVKQLVEDKLKVNQKVVVPKIKDEQIRVSSATGKDAVVDYTKKLLEDGGELKEKVEDTIRNAYIPEYSPEDQLKTAASETGKHVSELYNLAVPKEVVGFHKAYLGLSESLKSQVNFSIAARGSEDPDWSEVYKESVISDAHILALRQAYDGLDKKYSLSKELNLGNVASGGSSSFLAKLGLVKEANAFLGIGDFTFTYETFSIVELIKDIVGAAVGQVISKFIQLIISKIEATYSISNFLYYSDAVLSGRYVNDYLDKYVPDNMNQDLIKRFIPQINCGVPNSGEIAKLTQQKSAEYLGFDPKNIDPESPEFWSNVNKVAHLAAKPDGQQLIAKTLAEVTVSQASKAVGFELTSQGKKSGVGSPSANTNTTQNPVSFNVRTGQSAKDKLEEDTYNRFLYGDENFQVGYKTAQIKLSTGAIQSAQSAGIVSSSLQVTLSRSFVQQTLQSIISAFINKFVFQSAGLVLKEQGRQACLTGIAQFGPIIPAQLAPAQPIKIDDNLIEACKQAPETCAKGDFPELDVLDADSGDKGQGSGDPNTNGTVFSLDRPQNVPYKVGEVPKYKLNGSEPNEIIYFASDSDPRTTSNDNINWISYEIDGEIQMTDEKGNWPNAGEMPWNEAWTCQDTGKRVRLIKVGSKVYEYKYQVINNPANPCL